MKERNRRDEGWRDGGMRGRKREYEDGGKPASVGVLFQFSQLFTFKEWNQLPIFM